ncbi:MAG: hypothetical protein L0K41_08435, partial [Yaniella sp.]|nr:hypothetical protein [Yaniella sp.]
KKPPTPYELAQKLARAKHPDQQPGSLPKDSPEHEPEESASPEPEQPKIPKPSAALFEKHRKRNT